MKESELKKDGHNRPIQKSELDIDRLYRQIQSEDRIGIGRLINQTFRPPLQIVPEWLPVACKLYPRGRQSHENIGRFYSCCMRLAATRVQFSGDWRPLGYNLYATGSHSGTIYMQLAASRMQTLHSLAASCLQSCQFFSSTLQEQLF
jgi:hypothetical protein